MTSDPSILIIVLPFGFSTCIFIYLVTVLSFTMVSSFRDNINSGHYKYQRQAQVLFLNVPLLLLTCGVLGFLSFIPSGRAFLPTRCRSSTCSRLSVSSVSFSSLEQQHAPCRMNVLSLHTAINDDMDMDMDIEENSNVYDNEEDVDDVVDVAIIGAGLGGLCAGAILNTLYGKKVAVYESHYLAGGCAHAFTRRTTSGVDFTFDSGPSILLGCSSPPFNALQQVLQAVGQDGKSQVEWIPYTAWGMIEKNVNVPGNANGGQDKGKGTDKEEELKWRLELGENKFQQGPLLRFGGIEAVTEFEGLRIATAALTAGANIPAMAMRSGPAALIPLLRLEYLPTLFSIIKQGDTVTGTFAPFMDGPLYTVENQWLRNWLDALAFSLSGLPASRTSAAAMAFVLTDMHRPGAALDYPVGGMGSIIEALVEGVQQGEHGSKVHLRQRVASIDFDPDANSNSNNDGKKQRVTGITLNNGKIIRARDGVICNAPVWSLNNLIKDERMLQTLNGGNVPSAPTSTDVHTRTSPPSSWNVTEEGSSIQFVRQQQPIPNDPNDNSQDNNNNNNNNTSLLHKCDTAEMTGSFLHLHLAVNATGLNITDMEAHYTVMDRSLAGDGTVTVNGVPDGPCGEGNMIAVSNPCVIDKTLAPAGYMVIHAYCAGNEPYAVWDGLDRRSEEYKQLKEERAEVLWRAVESIIPDVRERVVLQMVGSPVTHERFLRRPKGTYGSATEDYLKDGTTPFANLVLAGDGCFPGIGVPAVAISGASAANALVGVLEQWLCLDKLKKRKG
jgi:phytoene dehydrogenase-like protein